MLRGILLCLAGLILAPVCGLIRLVTKGPKGLALKLDSESWISIGFIWGLIWISESPIISAIKNAFKKSPNPGGAG
ncbi:MAG: hypothetical protein ABIC19_02340 [Patescibacteria group bacterium]|nr:hypothetical protein [Patescibacteria group bacterium]